MDIHPSFFQIFKNDNFEEGISEIFSEILNKCSNPKLICIFGEENIEKSLILNQIINGVISKDFFNLEKPFIIPKETVEMNKKNGYYIYGPLKIKDLLKNNNIDENQISKEIINNELFFAEINNLKNVEDTNQSLIFNILAILFMSSIKIIHTQNIDYEKLDEIQKIFSLSKFLYLKTIPEKINAINLIGEITLKEKEENKIVEEIENQKIFLQKKINDYILKNNFSNINVICKILPSFKLSYNDVGNYPIFYKSELKSLIMEIISNIQITNECHGNKFIDSINEIISFLKEMKGKCEAIKSNDNALNLIFVGLFEEKINKIYFNIMERINKFDKEIICLMGKMDSIKNMLIDEIKRELNNSCQNIINNEIRNIIEKYSLKIDFSIRENINKTKNKINEEIILINDINNNKKVIEYISKLHYQEEIDLNNIANIIKEEIKLILSKYQLFFECIEEIDKEYRNSFSSNPYINLSNLNSNNNLMLQKPKWKDNLNDFILKIDANVIEQYKNKILEQKSIREIQREIKNNFEQLRKEIDIYTEKEKFFIYRKKDYENKIEELIIKLKNELNIQLIILREKNKQLIQRTIPDGIYAIVPVCFQDKAIEIKNNDPSDINLQLADFNNSNNQLFEIVYSCLNQFYVIKNLCSEKYLSVDYHNNNNIFQIPKHYGNSQQWHIASLGDNYQIISEYNEYPIEISENNNDDKNANISCKPNTGELYQQFQFKFCVASPQNQLLQPLNQSIYFKKTPYDGYSIVEGLNKIGVDSSFAYRKQIAKKNNIEGYAGTPDQNLYMLKLLKQGVLIKP